ELKLGVGLDDDGDAETPEKAAAPGTESVPLDNSKAKKAKEAKQIFFRLERKPDMPAGQQIL
ncbi:MAG: hypothetical protein ACRECH_18835, partial [Nitrososphaerales archaeon]